jgi:hypothetical protein
MCGFERRESSGYLTALLFMHSTGEAEVPACDAPEYRLEREYEDVAAVTETRWCNGAQAPGGAASVSPSVM